MTARKRSVNIERRDTKNDHRPNKRRGPPMPIDQAGDAL
jgi:hypothetical protein